MIAATFPSPRPLPRYPERRALRSRAVCSEKLPSKKRCEGCARLFIKDRTTEQTYPNGTRTAQIRAQTAHSDQVTWQTTNLPDPPNTTSRYNRYTHQSRLFIDKEGPNTNTFPPLPPR